jgi:hypothetical protein
MQVKYFQIYWDFEEFDCSDKERQDIDVIVQGVNNREKDHE